MLRVLPALLAVSCAATDLATGKIPNIITFSFMLTGIICRISVRDTSLFYSLFLMAAVFCFLFPFWSADGIGAGDIKLFMAASCVSEPHTFIRYFFFSFVFAGVFAAFFLISEKFGNRKRKIRMGIPIGLAILLSEVMK